jgi:hypothetical protein
MKIKLYYLVFLVLALTSCSSWKIGDPISTDPAYTNKQITLLSSDFNNSFKTFDILSVEIWNKSGKQIIFPNNYNFRIFEKTKKGWVEITEEPVTRLPAGDVIFTPTGENFNMGIVDVFPDLPNLNRKYDLRIYVFGQMIENNEEVEVAAFTDVTLKP